MTYLELINAVLVRLRENEVLSVTDTSYSKLIGTMVNDVKFQVEAAYPWEALNTDITVSTVAGQSSYSVVGSGQRFRIIDVVNDTDNSALQPMTWKEMSRLKRTEATGNNAPRYYAFNNIDNNGDTKVEFYPTPDAAYSVVFTCNVPQAKLTSGATVLQCPALPVELGAYARAVAERGEDQGMASSELYGLYRDALSDQIAIESSRTLDDGSWGAV